MDNLRNDRGEIEIGFYALLAICAVCIAAYEITSLIAVGHP